jgi:hypothetical protein
MPFNVPDIATIQRKTHKIAVSVGIAAFVVIVASGVLVDLFRQSVHEQQQPPALGRLHIKYEPGKETPYVDVFTDRETLAAWRAIFVDAPASQTEADVIADYAKLVQTGKLTPVDPDTLVRVTQREHPTDCRVTILSEKHREETGWVDCRWIE